MGQGRSKRETRSADERTRPVAPPPSPARVWRDPRAAAALAVVLTLALAAFWPALENGFTNWDDDRYVTDSSLITGLSAEHLQRIFTSAVKSNYHPLTVLSLAVDHRLFGLDPFGYHLTSLLLHLLASALVFHLAFEIGGGRPLVALITAGFFGIHPMHVESVAWVSARKDVLYACFFLAALIAYLRFARTRRRTPYAVALGLFALSLLSKPAAVVLPVVLLLLDRLDGHRADRRSLAEKIPFFALALIFGLIALETQSRSAMVGLERHGIAERLLFACYGFVGYLVKLFAPLRLSALYPYPPGELPASFYLAPLPALAIVACTVGCRRRSPVIFFGLAFYAVNVVLVLQLITVGNAVMADRYTYLAYVGPLFALASLCAWAHRRGAPWLRHGLVALLLLSTIACVQLSRERCRVWKNGETLWTDVLEKHPTSHLAHYNRGVFYRVSGDAERALAEFDRAVALKPDYARAYHNRGVIHLRAGRTAAALAEFDRALEADASLVESWYNRAQVHQALNDPERALRDYDAALALEPLAAGHSNRGNLYFERGEYRRALEDYDRAVELDPRRGAFRLNRSSCLHAMGRNREALSEALEARRLGQAVDAAYIERLKSEVR